jgi:hypothetical protein
MEKSTDGEATACQTPDQITPLVFVAKGVVCVLWLPCALNHSRLFMPLQEMITPASREH